MPSTRKGRPTSGQQRSALIVAKGKKSGRDAQVTPKRGPGVVVRSRPLESKLEVGDSVEAFLERATLRETEYADRGEVSAPILVSERGGLPGGTTTRAENNGAPGAQEDEQAFSALQVPRRPYWDATTSPDDLRAKEEAAFTAWRRTIAAAEEAERARREAVLLLEDSFLSASATVATPFERNLDVWRQLWRTLERSDCVFVVADARWPEFYVNPDLCAYVSSLGKEAIVLVNKADFLTPTQRRAWRDHFANARHLRAVFFSAKNEQERLDRAFLNTAGTEGEEQRLPQGDGDGVDEPRRGSGERRDSAVVPNGQHNIDDEEDEATRATTVDDPEDRLDDDDHDDDDDQDEAVRLLRPREVLALGAEAAKRYQEERRQQKSDGEEDDTSSLRTIGMVGYPNVGKSSCVNALRGANRHGVGARAGVSATPGKTKHLQTLRVGHDLELCDCPGLVFPALVAEGAAELACAGVVPLARARDPLAAAALVLKRVRLEALDAQYGTKLAAHKLSSADATFSPGALLDEFCAARGYVNAGSGAFDRGKAARQLVFDYVDGRRILYCHAPPAADADLYAAETRKTAARLSQKQQLHFPPHGAEDADDADDDVSRRRLPRADVSSSTASGLLLQQHQPPASSSSSSRAHRSWGKKGRKFRDPDPYRSRDDLDVVA